MLLNKKKQTTLSVHFYFVKHQSKAKKVKEVKKVKDGKYKLDILGK